MQILNNRLVLGLLAAVLLINLTYSQDPWLWRNYIRFFSSGDPQAIEMLPPDEEIRGDGSLLLPVATPAERSVSATALEAMHTFAEEFGSHALITVHKGVIQDEWYADYWQADYLTQSQSMHKSLMGLFIGIAIDEGKIASVDDPVGLYLQEWINDPRGEITLRNLMYMSSGLDQYEFTINPFADGIKWLNSGHSGEVILRTPDLDIAQGVEWEYNNLNSELLGMVLERVYDQRYSELLREKLWLPMGGDRALVHTDAPDGRAFTSCCLMAPAMDWARVGMMFLNRGEVNGQRIVSAAWIDEMVTPSPVAGHYGYQVWLGYQDPPFPEDNSVGSSGAIASEAFLARDTYMTWGRGQQHVYVVPSEELIIVRLGPALGRQPIKPGYDVPYLVNTAVRGLRH
jgi:CubicO group peptidase (beta-lactamase class C family)